MFDMEPRCKALRLSIAGEVNYSRHFDPTTQSPCMPSQTLHVSSSI